ncbi:hypothetical protein [Bifidobacterium avesanii]|uniref:Uncharacterized protein n=1 Tax=Bifidobacterium avesanii TaxID=1798157 RepID=A0A7K3TGP9_9BIFI|nr:hypothetical protein [Bifidobacterium avesanii]KAB8291502.1 hypothetical protein DSM100685_1220 [Bifidobacterium avesanii]NEG77869.1 hypothetical protein [Bifidobacterium avesanii]
MSAMFGLFSIAAALAVWVALIALTAVTVALAVFALSVMHRRPELAVPRRVAVPAGDTGATGPVALARRRLLTACTAGLSVLLVGFAADGWRFRWYGLALALLPGLAACAVMLVTALPFRGRDRAGHEDGESQGERAPSETPRVRVASLRPRRPWLYARGSVLMQPILIASLLIVYLVFTSCMATPDGESAGRSISLTDPSGEVRTTAGPYPGVYYAAPLIVVTVALAALTCLALRRIALAPASADGRNDAVDRLWRIALTRFATFLSCGFMLCYASGVMLFAGNATRLVGTNFGALPPSYADDVYPTLGAVQIGVGLGLLLFAVLYGLLAVAAAVKLWTGVTEDDAR